MLALGTGELGDLSDLALGAIFRQQFFNLTDGKC